MDKKIDDFDNFTIILARVFALQGISYARQHGENDKPIIEFLKNELGMEMNESLLEITLGKSGKFNQLMYESFKNGTPWKYVTAWLES